MGKAGKAGFLLLVALASCKGQEMAGAEEDFVAYEHFYTIDNSLEKDDGMERWLEPYRSVYDEVMGRPVAEAGGAFHYGQPESSLGNLVADMIRYRATYEMQTYVHIALLGKEDLKVEFGEGTVTVGDFHELMPENNTLVVLELKGESVEDLSDEIAEKGGVPVSGLRMTITDRRAQGVLVNSETVVSEKIYYVATSSSMAEGRDGFESLQDHTERHDFSVLIRDLFIDHMSNRDVFVPETDQRVRIN